MKKIPLKSLSAVREALRDGVDVIMEHFNPMLTGTDSRSVDRCFLACNLETRKLRVLRRDSSNNKHYRVTKNTFFCDPVFGVRNDFYALV